MSAHFALPLSRPGIALLLGALLVAPVAVAASPIFEETFDSDEAQLAPFGGGGAWSGHYASDPWRTDLNGGVSASRDDGCACDAAGNGGCDFTVYVGGASSDPFDDHITYLPPGEPWGDVTYTVRFRNDDDDAIGLLFRYGNTANFYMAMLGRDLAPGGAGCDIEFNGSALLTVIDGAPYLLAAGETTYEQGVEHELAVVAVGSDFQLRLDGAVILEASDQSPTPHASGGVGLFSYQNGASEAPCDAGGCWFDDLRVYAGDLFDEPIPDPAPDPEPDPAPELGPEMAPEPVPEAAPEPTPDPGAESAAEPADTGHAEDAAYAEPADTGHAEDAAYARPDVTWPPDDLRPDTADSRPDSATVGESIYPTLEGPMTIYFAGDDEGGCGCRSAREGGPLALLLGLAVLLFLARRRLAGS